MAPEFPAKESPTWEILDELPLAAWRTTPDGRIEFANRRWREYTALTAWQTRPPGWGQWIHPEDLEKLLREWERAASGPADLELECRLLRGHEREYSWHLLRANPVMDREGRPSGWSWTALNVESRKKSERSLEEARARLETEVQTRTLQLERSEERFRVLVEGVTDRAILMLDPKGEVVSWNDGVIRLKRYRADQIIGQSLEAFYTPEDAALGKPAEALRLARETGQCAEERWAVRGDGSRYWAEVLTTSLWDTGGALRGYSKVLRDISDRKRADEELHLERRRAEQVSHAKSEFLAVISHEIRTPLNAVLGVSDLLWETSLSEEQRNYVEVFRKSGAALLSLINDLLDFSKLEAGKMRLEETDFDLRAMVEDSVRLFEPRSRAKGLTLSYSLDPGTPVLLKGDAARLQQVLANLLSNAIKFTDAGSIMVCIRPGAAGPQGAIAFEVRDTGIGMTEEQQGRIFEAFEQADASTTRRHGGSGLGLAISRKLVEMMGGGLRVRSEPGQGAAFTFDVPMVPGNGPVDVSGKAATPVQDPVYPAPASERPLCILIAEDSEVNQLLFQSYFRKTPHTVRVVENGQAAVEAVFSGIVDLVLMDIRMPVMDGLTATREIRRRERERNLDPVPILAVTANARAEDIRAAREAGCTAHVAKPVYQATLLGEVARHGGVTSTTGAPSCPAPADRCPALKTEIQIPEELREIAPGYLLEQREAAVQMISLLENADWERIESLAHDLKGTGAAFGFPALSRLGAQLETAARASQSGVMRHALEELDRALTQAEMALLS